MNCTAADTSILCLSKHFFERYSNVKHVQSHYNTSRNDKNASVLWGKAGTGIFHRQKGNSSWTHPPQQTTRPSHIFTNVLSAISRYFITAMCLCPLTCEWIPVPRTWPISAYLRSIPTTANAQPAFLNYDTSAGMPHPPVGSRSSVLQIKTPLYVADSEPTCQCSGVRRLLLLPRYRRPQRLRCCFRRVCDYHRPAASWTWWSHKRQLEQSFLTVWKKKRLTPRTSAEYVIWRVSWQLI